MQVLELLHGLEYTLLQGSLNTEVTEVECDSRAVAAGSLFFCVPGSVRDGHDFAQEVAEKGASVLVVEHSVAVSEAVTVIQVSNVRYAMGIISSMFYGEPSKKLTVIGITGTKGKTTTAYMIQSMLEKTGHPTGLIGTIEMLDGKRVIPAANTTPESVLLQRTLRDMVANGLDSVVMEVSSQGLMLDRVAGVDFDYGIFTNLSEDHIGPNEHASFEEYRGWKAKLFQLCRVGIFNGDDPYYQEILEGHTCQVVTYGMKAGVDYCAGDWKLHKEDGHLGIEYHLSGKAEGQMMVNIPGKFSIYNSLSAIAVANEMQVPFSIIQQVLTTVRVRGRVELIPISDAFTILIDYAHNAVSLESILETLREYQPTRLVSVFGCGGNRSKTRRYEMGEVSGRLADFTIITSDNPRFEEPQDIMDDIITGISRTEGTYIEIMDRKEAFRYAILNAEPGDVIVLAGKGHEDYQEIKGVKYHMDERELIREVLEEEDVSKICGYNNRYFA
ncbi:MAG: UDP-N-acetylmuramoyl-L-alanyl-D-glutamate--2,6-diaminopimelate ligase [Bacteroides sp.]|nr:UDP-N-acetylmuramoyl-L-alanyl-D-glutamate--2,6-diaminopimelate ligase [Bacteroides sp.]MCM1548542.1 UDP-N-acetylmuramoyl-L-alanyl-D-glutamate--2,6-diaminopimelate ligase [Clostridium sp.]